MNTHAIKTIVIFILIFNHDVLSHKVSKNGDIISNLPFEVSKDVINIEKIKFGEPIPAHFESGYCNRTWDHIHGNITETTYDNEAMIKIVKYLYHYSGPHELDFGSHGLERIVMIYNSKKDSLLFLKHYIWKKEELVQSIDDGIVRNIISGKTPCDFTVIEPSGDSISYHLDPKKLDDSIKIRNNDNFLTYMSGIHILSGYVSRLRAIDAIMYQQYSYCQKHYEKHKTVGALNDSVYFHSYTEDIDISMKDNCNFLSRISPYKYYAIIIASIIVASIGTIYKKQKRNRK